MSNLLGSLLLTRTTGGEAPPDPVGLDFAYTGNSMYLCLF